MRSFSTDESMRIDYHRIENPKDKWRHRAVTLFVFLVALAIFVAMQAGWLGATLQGFAVPYLIGASCLLAVRAVLTEAGFRRRT